MKQIEMHDTIARGRNGDFEVDRLVYSKEGDRLVIEAFSKRKSGTKQAPIRLDIPADLGAEIAAALVIYLGIAGMFVSKKPGAMACEGLDPNALAKLGRGGLAQLLARLDLAALSRNIEAFSRGAQDDLRIVSTLVPAGFEIVPERADEAEVTS